MVWLTEFVGSFLLVFIPTIFGHGQVGTEIGFALTATFYFVLLPFLYLVNDTDVKNTITDDSWFHAIRGIFDRTNVQVIPK